MNALLSAIVGALVLAEGPGAEISLLAGPPRAFGGRAITRTFRVEGEGRYVCVWRTRVFRGEIERGEATVDAPAELKIELHLPTVRARVELVQEVQVRDEQGNVAAEGSFPLAVFPDDILSRFAESQAGLAPFGLCDPEDAIAPTLRGAGLEFTPVRSNIQVRALESRMVLVAPGQAGRLGEPMGGIWELLENDGTVVLLEQSTIPKDLLREDVPLDVVERTASEAYALIGANHPALLDIRGDDLSNWAGSGQVASHAVPSSEGRGQRALLVTGFPERLPVLSEYWGENGRLIVCELEVGKQLRDEPVAQVLLRNLLVYARNAGFPGDVPVTRIAVGEDAVTGGKFSEKSFVVEPSREDMEKAAALLLLAGPRQTSEEMAESGDLARFLREDGMVVLVSPFNDNVTDAVNHLVRSAWRDDPRTPLPTFRARETDLEQTPEIDYDSSVMWGVSWEGVLGALWKADPPRALEAEREVAGLGVLVRPGFVLKFERGKSRLVLICVPVSDPDDKAATRLVDQVLDNLVSGPGGEDDRSTAD